MPEFVSPGVYIEELEQGPRPIEGVPTSTAGFLGETERGPLRPRLVTSFNDYAHWFGGVFADGRYMPHAVSGFFENGGKRLYVCRIVGCGATTASRAFGDFTVTAAGPGAWGRRVWVRIQDGSTRGVFRLKLAYWSRVQTISGRHNPFETINKDRLPRPQYQEDFDDLSIDPSSLNFFEKRSIDSSTGRALVTHRRPPVHPQRQRRTTLARRRLAAEIFRDRARRLPRLAVARTLQPATTGPAAPTRT